ncbi:MAG: UTRA domain-containing protein [Bacteroidetes bacterium]|jgi:GntR family transcriptional regulator|nr:UTRA domain-containing protein [Bacteroidota bacterium]
MADSSNLPRHAQISQELREAIEKKVYGPKEKLPSEKELAEEFQVSRITVRRALQTLENEHLIQRSQGRGSFVCDAQSGRPALELTDFTEDMARAGRQATSNVLSKALIKAPERVSAALQIPPKTKVLELIRLRLADGQPIAIDKTYLPIFYAQLIEDENLKEQTIYQILETKYDITIQKGCIKIKAGVAPLQWATQLEVQTNDPILQVERVSYTIQEKPVYYQIRFNRFDKVQYELMAERQSGVGCAHLPLKEFMPIYSIE